MNSFSRSGLPALPMRARVLLPAALVASAFGARAQGLADYPARPVRWIVPTSAGAGTDAAGRAFARVAAETWKQGVVVENRSGASGMIGLDTVAQAAPDGYTLGFFSVSHFLDATLQNKYLFEAQKDFTPISLLASTPMLLVASVPSGLDTLAQLVAAAKARPRALNYSSGGAGGITHFAMEVFLKHAGIAVTHVPYRGGGQAMADLVSGQVQIAFITPPAAMPHVKAGRLRPLALASPSRSLLAPEVPTFAELGVQGVSFSTWYGLFGPGSMAPELVDRISRTVTAASRPAAVRDQMMSGGFEPVLNTPAEFAAFLKADREQWLAVAKAINFKRES